MTYLSDLHSYLHQSSLLIQAYPSTRITTKYSLPRRPSSDSKSKRSKKAASNAAVAISESTATSTPAKEKREPAATLTLKTFHAESGICLKYQTDKAQEVGRLLNGLGRLAKGELIEMPSSTTTGTAIEDKMGVDGGEAVNIVKDGKSENVGKSATEMTQQQQSSAGGGGKKKKKGKK